MPIYEYICKNCGCEFIDDKSINDRDKAMCPKCRSIKIRRLLSSPNVIYNSDGFYTTDNKDKKDD